MFGVQVLQSSRVSDFRLFKLKVFSVQVLRFTGPKIQEDGNFVATL